MNTEEKKSDALKYLRVNARDEEWGIVITTVGYQYVSPNHAYPLSKHPDNYNFKNEGKRTLNEYQLVYITRGEGYFSSRSCPKTHIACCCSSRENGTNITPTPEPAGTNIG